MPNDFYYHLTAVECFPYLGTWLRWLQQCLCAWVMGGGQYLLKQVSYACMDVLVQHAELFDAPA